MSPPRPTSRPSSRPLSRYCILLATALLVASASATVGCPALGSVYRDRDDVTVALDLPYIDDGAATHKLDLYEPVGADDDAPVVVFIHGGYWVGQDKQYWEFASGLYGNVGVALAREGIRVANINYRLFPEVKLRGMLDDVDAAADFVRERFPEAPVFLMGHSAGAHLSSAAALLPNGPKTRVDGLLLISGIYDVENAVDLDSRENREDILEPLFGESDGEQRAASTDDHFVDADFPVLFVAGSADFQAVALDFRTLERELGDVVDPERFQFVRIEGSDHAGTALQIGTDDDEVTPAVLTRMADVLKR